MQKLIALPPNQRAQAVQLERAVMIAQYELDKANSALHAFYGHILAADTLKVEQPAGDTNVTITDVGLCFDVPEAPEPTPQPTEPVQ